MDELRIKLAGFGGQGILFLGKVMAYAGLTEGREVSWLPSYGPEMRGGTANCSVCISDEPIGSPLVIQQNVLIAMNLPSYEKFIDMTEKGGIALIDSSLIDKKTDRTDISAFYVPATELATKNDMKGLANMIMLGKLLAETHFCSEDSVKKAIERSVPKSKQHLVEVNFRAVHLGMES